MPAIVFQLEAEGPGCDGQERWVGFPGGGKATGELWGPEAVYQPVQSIEIFSQW